MSRLLSGETSIVVGGCAANCVSLALELRRQGVQIELLSPVLEKQFEISTSSSSRGDLFMTLTKSLENISITFLPPLFCRAAKRVVVYPRCAIQRHKCQRGFKKYGETYRQKVLFIAGLPKSGTTWLENMLSSFQGFGNLLIPDVAKFELATGGSHNYDLPRDMFSRFKNMLVVTKMHVPGSEHNVEVLRKAGVKYVIMYRDLRDVAVSHYYYVKQTPWHPVYPFYRKFNLEQALKYFADNALNDFAGWIRLWDKNRDIRMSIVITYEQLLTDTFAAVTKVAKHFELDSSSATISKIVKANTFEKLSGGRRRGKTNSKSFFRSGTSGNWKKHFAPELKNLYKEKIGDFLIDYGYEKDKSW